LLILRLGHTPLFSPALAKGIREFEGRDLDGLIGAYSQARVVYQVPSPVHFADRLTWRVAFFQDLEDRGGDAPGQARTMYAAVRGHELPTMLAKFEGEGRGFQGAENIPRALEGGLLCGMASASSRKRHDHPGPSEQLGGEDHAGGVSRPVSCPVIHDPESAGDAPGPVQ